MLACLLACLEVVESNDETIEESSNTSRNKKQQQASEREAASAATTFDRRTKPRAFLQETLTKAMVRINPHLTEIKSLR
jgi:hypothetical protein